jgi:5'(3')-deoxyribonucleotidase
MNNPTVFLDMDEVLSDFIGGAFKLLSDKEPSIKECPMRVGSIERILGLTTAEMWDRVDRFRGFWPGLDPLPWAKEIVDKCKTISNGNLFILTASGGNEWCEAGKSVWIKRHFPELQRRTFKCSREHKQEMSGPGKILIDDSEENVEKWNARGGSSVLFPALSNPLWKLCVRKDAKKFVLDHVYKELNNL